MRAKKYTREVLAPVVANARSISDVIRAFGLRTTGGNHRAFSARIAYAQLDTSHFTYGKGNQVIANVSREELVALTERSTSIAQMLAILGLGLEGRAHHDLTRRLRDLSIDSSHFAGRGWARGKTRDTDAALDRGAQLRAFPDDEVFIERSLITRRGLLSRLLRLGWRYECKHCGIAAWRGRQLILHIDHINGKHYDNRLDNLRMLCPNCHSQTPTFGNRRR